MQKKEQKKDRAFAYKDIQTDEGRQKVYDNLNNNIKDIIKEMLDKDLDKFGIPAACLSAAITTVTNAVYVG